MQRVAILAATAFAALGAAFGAQAQVTGYDIGINPTYHQTGPSTVTSTGGFFSTRVFLTNASDFDGGTISWPGAMSPQTLSPASGPILTYGFGDGSLADLNSQFPTGTYNLKVTNSMTSASQALSVDYAAPADSLSIPELTPATFNALQGLNPHAGFTFDFNAFLQNPNASVGFVFLNVFDASGTVFSEGFANPATTSIFMPGGTLAAGKAYNFDLLFDERVQGADPNSQIPNEIFFDTHTGGSFATAAVPEPAIWATMLLGVGMVGGGVRMARRKTAAAMTAA